ncbi:hypothetical protein EGW08_004762 [Elysia chlorotica]|uniref:Dynein regulatory complex protein 9 n=1 Tax=Elysia chlorotica TaxID=188477 RepID=A0A3S1BG41_ELYCH|nr:hypothetical protein EGW08_004762 [Elysia chlorotica]
MRGYLLRQFYMPKVIKRVWQSNKETPTRPLEEMMKNAGLKRSNARHKLQGDIGLIKSMMANIFNELVQKGTWHSLNNHLTEEREELLKLSKANQRLMGMRAYSKELRGEINETKQSKKRELHALKSLEHQIENDGQELCVRTEIEAAYTQHMVAAKIEESKKASEIAPRATEEEMERVKKWMFIEDRAHENIRMFLLLCLERVSSLLDYWIEKYEVDKERLMADLEELKDERAATAAHRERLEAKIKLWMPIIKDNRRIVKRREDEKRYLQKCAYYATKVAARWRGYMVRAGVGRFGSMFA